MSHLSTELTQGAQNWCSTAFAADMANPTSFVAASSPVTEALPVTAPTLTEIVDALSSAASTAYSALLPLEDIANALTTAVPAYDLSLYTDTLASPLAI